MTPTATYVGKAYRACARGDLVRKVVIVIDALDEAGSEASRKDIFPILSTPASSFPPSFRILVTSRPFPDVQGNLMNLPHVRDVSLDGVPTADDIHLYVTSEFANQKEIGSVHFRAPANMYTEFHACHEDDRYEVNVILGFMGSLFSGVTDVSKPIHPLHALFYDLLTDASRSGDYFVGKTMDANLAVYPL
ncbi:hypothetical protein ID866_5211 [Astraeus odoratus]|nr:hypothetical protein ID866_5211 [Astraeus odoratus]